MRACGGRKRWITPLFESSLVDRVFLQVGFNLSSTGTKLSSERKLSWFSEPFRRTVSQHRRDFNPILILAVSGHEAL